MDTNYFVCTLGEAALFDDGDPPYKNINEFVQLQAKRVGNKPAVGFYSRSSSPNESWRTHVLSFSDVHRGSLAVADILSRSSKQGLFHSKTVALLCPSSADFLFTWLALMRLGHSVLLIATQLQPSAIAQLCTQCEVSCLLHDGNYVKLARATGELKAEEKEKEFWIIDVGSVMGEGVFQTISQSSNKEPQMPSLDETDVAYLHHTSGTSSGMPKPIPQSHRAALGVLPRLDGSATATFTTTPLYHGGIADLFRAWTSDALIWLFPGKDLPITAANVVRCLDQYEQQAQKYGIPRVAYFSSVPYVLEMMRGSDRGLQCLQKMDIVGVGGAALPAEVGDDLVQHSINLVSRFGSAECGFLLSSHREYNQDKDWQHLRQNPAVKSLKFERQEDGTAELIVLSGWPHMVSSQLVAIQPHTDEP